MQLPNLRSLLVALAVIVTALVTIGSPGTAFGSTNTISGRLWVVSDATSRDASPANVPTATPDVTFDVNSPLDFGGPCSGSPCTFPNNFTIGQWLASGAAFNIAYHNGVVSTDRMADGVNGAIVEFTGFVTVSNGDSFTVTHDDGLTLVIGSDTVINVPGPTPATVTSESYTGPSGTLPFQLVYGECCGGPAVLQLDLPLTNPEIGLTPETATNEAGTDHTVTATVDAAGAGIAGQVVTFSVDAGPNAGASGTCSVNTDCTTDANGQVSWTYTGAFATGNDTISACFTDFAGVQRCASAAKTWVDTTAPTAQCIETTNPSGKNVPTAGPNAGKSGQNPDGFYQVLASDSVGVASIVIKDSGSPFVSDPFNSGDKVKITQAPGVTPSDNRPGPGDIVSHLKLKGDAVLVVTDASGNVTEVSCLVPPPPK